MDRANVFTKKSQNIKSHYQIFLCELSRNWMKIKLHCDTSERFQPIRDKYLITWRELTNQKLEFDPELLVRYCTKLTDKKRHGLSLRDEILRSFLMSTALSIIIFCVSEKGTYLLNSCHGSNPQKYSFWAIHCLSPTPKKPSSTF